MHLKEAFMTFGGPSVFFLFKLKYYITKYGKELWWT